MKIYYCANCGTKLGVALKAVQGNVIRLVEAHKCLDEPIKFDLSPVETPTYVPEIGEKNKFVQKLNDLGPAQRNIPTPDMKDRRPNDQIKSDAPLSVYEQIRGMQNTVPDKSIPEDPPE